MSEPFTREKCSICGDEFDYCENEENEDLEDYVCHKCIVEISQAHKDVLDKIRNHGLGA